MISIRNVSKSYGQVKVLHDIDLEIPQSQVFALIGPSGAGKSTLIRTINALEDIQEGEILIDGVSVHDKKRISTSFVPTSDSSFSRSTCIRI